MEAEDRNAAAYTIEQPNDDPNPAEGRKASCGTYPGQEENAAHWCNLRSAPGLHHFPSIHGSGAGCTQHRRQLSFVFAFWRNGLDQFKAINGE